MYIYNDGGRVEAGFKAVTDCAIRAVAIACELSYKDSRKLLQEFSAKGVLGSRAISNQVYIDDLTSALESIGWVWCKAPIFKGRKAKYSDLPMGRHIVRMKLHVAAVVNGEIHDDWDSSKYMVYGYWSKL